MTVKELIEELSKYPPDISIAIVDWQKNMEDDSDEGSSIGVYDEIEVHHFTDEELEGGDGEGKPFIALLFDTDPPIISDMSISREPLENGYKGDSHSQD